MKAVDLIDIAIRLESSGQLNAMIGEGLFAEIQDLAWRERLDALAYIQTKQEIPFMDAGKLFKSLAWDVSDDDQTIKLAAIWQSGYKWPKGKGKIFQRKIKTLRQSNDLQEKIKAALRYPEAQAAATKFFETHGVRT